MSAAEPAGVYRKLGLRKVVNAADTYTVLGGGPLPDEVRTAMDEAAGHHVDVVQLLAASGEHLAQLTRNEAALVVNGAAAGMAIATAACIAGDRPAGVGAAPAHRTERTEVVLLCAQRNPYDRAVLQGGGTVIEVGYSDNTHAWQLESAIGPRTAAVLWFAGTQFERYALPLQAVLDVAHAADVPVIVDAAAQLPPVDNLWHYTEAGADLVLFSGGKGLRGPQNSGLVLGRRDLVRACAAHSYPHHSLGRAMKTSKESIVGLVAAVERALALDWDGERLRWRRTVSDVVERLDGLDGVQAWATDSGPLGQAYPRAMFRWQPAVAPAATALAQLLAAKEPAVHIGRGELDDYTAWVNPTLLSDGELDIVMDAVTGALHTRGRE